MTHWLLEILETQFKDTVHLPLIRSYENYINEVPFIEDPVRMESSVNPITPLKPYLIVTKTGMVLIAIQHPILTNYWISFHSITELSFAIHTASVKLMSAEPLNFTMADIRPFPQYQNLRLLTIQNAAPLTVRQMETIEANEIVSRYFKQGILGMRL